MRVYYNRYGLTAVDAAKSDKNPIESWKIAVKSYYYDSIHSQKKGCPKNTFLGLCEEGLVKGIPKGDYTKSVKNKKYALNAVHILKANPNNSFTTKQLWDTLELGDKKHNSQMDVVLALWNKDMLHK